MKHNYIILKLFTALLVLVIGGLHFIANSQEHGWEQMRSMNTARAKPASCVIDNKIYVFGGYSGTGGLSVTASVEIYYIENNEWTPLKNMDQALVTTCAGMIDNKIYLMGGWARINNIWQSVNTNLEYDYETDSYLEKENIPINNMSIGTLCVYNDSIYTFGGMNFEVTEKRSWKYNPSMDKWDSISVMLFQHGEATANIINNKIYVIGGTEGSVIDDWKITGKVEMYNPDSDSWEEKAELPIPVRGHISVVHNNKILVFGGDTGYIESSYSTGSNLIQEYDPAENTWETKHGMPFKRSGMAGHKAGKYVYIIAGKENGRNFDEPVLSEVWRFNLDFLKDPVATDVIENKTSNNVTLHQNYPNPFREYTQIKYDSHREGFVKLQVFNFLGQEVITLVNKYQRPGNYEVTWNAKNIKPGIYYVKLKVGDFEETRKAVVY